MAAWTQSLTLAHIGLTGWRTRVGTSIVIIVGMSCVVGVLASALAVHAGMMRMATGTGDPSQAIVVGAKSPPEFGGVIARSDVTIILNAPGIARGPSGSALADAEVRYRTYPPDGIYWQGISITGIGAAGIDLRPNFRVVAGRMFKPGLHELLIGRSAQQVYGLKIGDAVPVASGQWLIVGVFSSGGDLLESQLVTDAVTLMTSTRMLGYGNVLVRLQSPQVFDPFKRWLTTNPALQVSAERQAQYYIRSAGFWLNYFNFFAYFAGAVMSIGALFGSINLLYGVVSARGLEIATFRALGYRALPVAASVVAEAALLAIIGAIIGLSVAWVVFDGRQMVNGFGIFSLFLSAQVVALCLGWVIVLALVGALPPALRAARLPVSEALRAS
ncbi:MAG TPA: FtsX-like permease family protein [Steroidobacteraceae bacterium]